MPSPKSGNAIPPDDPLAPGKAAKADKSKSGAVTTTSAGAVNKVTPGKYAHIPVPPPRPIPAVRPPKSAPPGPPKDCSIADLLAGDRENTGKRVPGDANILQIVPQPTESSSVLPKWFKLARIDTKSGGDDDIAAEVKPRAGSGGPSFTCLLPSSSAPGPSDWTAGATHTFKVKPPKNRALWPSDADPAVHYLWGKGCDSAEMRVRLEVFPSESRKVTIAIGEFRDLISAIYRGWGSFKTYFGDQVAKDRAKEARSQGTGVGTLTGADGKPVGAFDAAIDPGDSKLSAVDSDSDSLGDAKKFDPKGSFSVEWGWAEDTNWMAYFGVDVRAGLDPLFSFDWNPTLSLAVIAYSACGIPPPIAQIVAKCLFDVYLQFELKFESSVTGGLKFRHYTYGDDSCVVTQRPKGFSASDAASTQGSLKCLAKGSLGILLVARVGNKWVISVTVTGAARTAVNTTAGVLVQAEGVFLDIRSWVDPIELSVEFELRAFVVYKKKKDKKWPMGGPWHIYPRDDRPPIKLLPRDDGEGMDDDS